MQSNSLNLGQPETRQRLQMARRPGRISSSARSRFLLIGLLIAGCSSNDPPNAPIVPPAPPPPATISTLASRYLTDVLDIMQANSLKRLSTDWPAFRASVFSKAGPAQTIADLDAAIGLALELLVDGHSSYTSAAGRVISAPTRNCRMDPIPPIQVPAGIGYVRIRAFFGNNVQAAQFAAALQDSIRRQDSNSLIGWIVDLRGNTGGNMWPMLAGIGPVLGPDTVGMFVGPAPTPTLFWEYRDGAARLSGLVLQQVENPYTLVNDRPPVAVLIDNDVVSSGEAIAIAFRKRPRTRSFGAATCGLSTSNRTFVLSDGASLNLTNAVMADREGLTYGDEVSPDESLSSANLAEWAIAWLRSAK